MKELLIFILTCNYSNINSVGKIQRQYQECKAECQNGENGNCPSCINQCQHTKCRSECYANQNDFKNSKECKEYQNCKTEHRDPCDPKPCIDKAHSRKECFEQCKIISDLADTEASEGEAEKACTECFCYNKFTYEYLGKAECEKDTCTSCENRCNKKFAKYKNQIKAICNNKAP